MRKSALYNPNQSAISDDVLAISQRVRKAEDDINELVIRNEHVEEKAAEVTQKLQYLQKHGVKPGGNGENKCVIVLRGLPESAKEKHDSNVTINLVYNVIREGLK